MRLFVVALFFIGAIILIAVQTASERPVVFMATTTTQDSGLLDVLISELEKDTELEIKSVAFGTGKVLRSAADGNADVILVHDPGNELKFMNEGYGSERLAIMKNNFVLIGPNSDPANVRSSASAIEAFGKLAETEATFVSRADQSGTHNAEKALWNSASTDPLSFSTDYYIQTGAGMGRTLNVAIEKSAYVLADSATWIAYENKGEHVVLFSGDELLLNTYHLITVNTDRHPHISKENQNLIVNWFKSEKVQAVLENFRASGEQLYFPISSQ